MAIKLIKLKSGEDLISKVEEMLIDEKPVGYFLDRPCSIRMTEYEQDVDAKSGYKVELYSWIPLSKEQKIPIPIDWVVTITNPLDSLYEMYKNDILNSSKTQAAQNEESNTPNQ